MSKEKKIEKLFKKHGKRIKIAFIKASVKSMSKNHLIELKGLIDSYPDSEEKTEINEYLKKVCTKKDLGYLYE